MTTPSSIPADWNTFQGKYTYIYLEMRCENGVLSGSLLLQQGESPAYVKEQMDHSSIQVTVDEYGHLIPGVNKQAVDQLDGIASRECLTEPTRNLRMNGMS